MVVHSEYFRASSCTVSPSERMLESAFAVMEKAYSLTKMAIPEDLLSFESYQRAVQRLENSSSPGWPYTSRAPTIGDYLGFDGANYDDVMIQSLWNDVCVLIDGDFTDVMYTVFIKDEPHSASKVAEDRWRLIIASPLNVQVLWHMMFAWMNDKHIQCSYEIPSQQGIQMNAGGWRKYMGQWRSKGLNMGLDKRAWDWTVPGWKIRAILDFRSRMVYGRQKDVWLDMALRLYNSMFSECLLQTSSGIIFRQLVPGIMKSGCVNTISDNSMMQVLDHVLSCNILGISVYPLPVCCGDDTLQNKEQVMDLSVYASLGAIVKSATEGLEFVGHDFVDAGPQPLYLEKHLYKISYVKEDILPDVLDAMLRMYVYSPYYYVWYDVVRFLGMEHLMRSREYYLAWYEYQLD